MITARTKSSIFFLSILLIVGYIYTKGVKASGSCSVTVSPSSVQTSTDTNFGFAVVNNGTGTITTVKMTRPSENFNLENYGVSGWSINANNTFAELTGGTVAPGATLNFSYHGISGGSEASSANWQVTTNDGSGEVACSGSLGTAISGVTDTNAPNIISDPSVTDITSTSAVISWTTDELSTSNVDYGPTADLGLTKNDTTMVTVHSVTLTGLTASTTYSFNIYSADASGNTRLFTQNSLTTASATSARTPTPTTTSVTATTSTTTTTTSTTAVVVVEKIPPVVRLTTDFKSPFEEAPEIFGEATDNKGVESVEYSTDEGVNWLPVDKSEGMGTKSISFSFTPFLIEDGNYKVLARAKDAAGNKGVTKTYTLVIDRLPPRIGGNLISLGPHSLMPNKDGVIFTLIGLETRIALSAVGGPITVDLFARPQSLVPTLGGDESSKQMFSFVRNPDTGLWVGAINFSKEGLYQLSTKAIDGAGNVTERTLNPVLVLPSGYIFAEDSKEKIDGAQITVYYKDPLTSFWTVWDAVSFGQENPQKLSEGGGYQYYLPPGTYYLEIKAKGFAKFVSKIFYLNDSTPLNSDYYLKPLKKIKIGPFSIDLPDFNSNREDIMIKIPSSPSGQLSSQSILDKEAPLFSLPTTGETFDLVSLRGKASLISFVNSWSPQSIEQISILDPLIKNREISAKIISTQESLSKISILQARGGYKSQIAVDEDGTLVEQYNITTLPTHFFLDRKGIVKKIVYGVLNKGEIYADLEEIK